MSVLLLPQPDVAAAITEITATLNWMRSTTATGGLGYSVIHVRQTHAHRALVALGGTWTPLR